MKKCANCGTPNKNGTKFCSKCGQPLKESNVSRKSKNGIRNTLYLLITIVLIILAVCFAYVNYLGVGKIPFIHGIDISKNEKAKNDSLAKIKSENESLKRKVNDAKSNRSSNKLYSSSTDVSAKNTTHHNDPELKPDGEASAKDLQGRWTLVQKANDPDNELPVEVVVDGNNLTEKFKNGDQDGMSVETIRWSSTDQLYYLSGEDSGDFTFNFEEKYLNGKKRILMKHVNQGMTSWYERK